MKNCCTESFNVCMHCILVNSQEFQGNCTLLCCLFPGASLALMGFMVLHESAYFKDTVPCMNEWSSYILPEGRETHNSWIYILFIMYTHSRNLVKVKRNESLLSVLEKKIRWSVTVYYEETSLSSKKKASKSQGRNIWLLWQRKA